MAKLYLVRHAQSANNAILDGRFDDTNRYPDPELTAIGQQQSEHLGGHFAHPQAEPRQFPLVANQQSLFGVTHLYCSLMTRSICTAEFISNACDLPLQALPNVFEKNGICEVDQSGERQGLPGQGRDYFESRFPDLILPQDMNDDGWWNRPAESEDAFITRVSEAVAEFRQRLQDSDANVALVAHGDFIDQFVNQLTGVVRHPTNYANQWRNNWVFHNTSISRIDFVDGAFQVVYLNRIDHLTPELVTW